MKDLKPGITTGLCAAAAAKAATVALLSGTAISHVSIAAMNGKAFDLETTGAAMQDGTARYGVQKDAGDDPDITNGMMVYATVSKTNGQVIQIEGGEGIGTVTKPGLKVAVGQTAINPVPRQMITSAIAEACSQNGYSGGITAIISIPGGEAAAKRTMNARLGIIGGLSVLGTTGIVEPMSERAIVETIKADIDVQVASGERRLVITPGNYGRDFAQTELGLDINKAIKCSNFIGETLDYACKKGVGPIILIGHGGKLVKLAAGIMNTHSSYADGRMEIIAAHGAMHGADSDLVKRIMECATVQAAVEQLAEAGINEPVWESIGEKIGFHLRERTRGALSIEYIVFTQEHGILTKGVSAK
ncbi:MAG: cobalt-precorrin-5B (C(1))-methyltransferase CbiD [Eubacteriaceae bacterium]|nr:cobalt-precorrin-5B (C(1))-methyltransferase CbiD [Eubacteriaceae bacterium]